VQSSARFVIFSRRAAKRQERELIIARRSCLMKQIFTASVWKEDGWFVAQCREVDVASQGESEAEALSNLCEALELHFESPTANVVPEIRTIEIEVRAA
jgi:predicted RNase H-like HicB family nuclease